MYIEFSNGSERKLIEIDAEALIELLRHGKAEYMGIIIKVV